MEGAPQIATFIIPALKTESMQPLIGSLHPFVTVIVLSALAIASFTDLRTREVSDWLNYALAVFGIGAGALLSVAFWTWTYVAYSILGMLVFWGIALLMYYAGQWGGGDSKLLIGLGASIGLPFSTSLPYFDVNSFLVHFWLNLLLTAVIYSTLWSAFLAVKHRKKTLHELKTCLLKGMWARRLVLLIAVFALASSFAFSGNVIKLLIASASLLTVFALYFPPFMKAVERASMLRLVDPKELTEGEWISKDIVVENERIAGPSDLGVSKEQIGKLEALHASGKIKKVLIKVGIPFVPSFLLAFVTTLLYGNLLGKIALALTLL